MSINVTASVEVQSESIDVTIQSSTGTVTSNNVCVTPTNSDNTIEVVKKEYSIVGDGLYASINTDEAPVWLTTIIDSVVNQSVNSGLVNYDSLVQDVRTAIEALNTAANTYVEQIWFDANIGNIIATHYTTLNATYVDNIYATVTGLETAVANADYALTQAINDITSAYTEEINSQITNIQIAYSAADTTLANSITALTVAFSDQAGNLSATADAVSTLQTYVGLDEDGNPDGTALLSRVYILEKQNDGIVEYTIDTYDVMSGIEDPNTDTTNDELDVTKEPYASWIAADTLLGTDETRASHIGDVYIMYADDVNGTRTYVKSYKFIKTAVDTSSPYSTDSEGYTWALVTDTDAQSAYVIALNAQDLADSKRRVFTVEPYGPYDIGDLWVDDSDSPQIIRTATVARTIGFLDTDWVTADEQTSYFVANTYEPDSAQLHRQLDGKIEYYFYESYGDIVGATDEASALSIIDNAWTTQELRDANNGNVVYFKDTTNAYWYQANTPAWLAITDTSIYQALQDAAAAQAAADGVIVSYYAWDQTTAPATALLWFADDNILYKYIDSAWTPIVAKEGDTLVAYNDTTKDVTFYEYRSGTWAMITTNGIVANSAAFTNLNLTVSTLDENIFGESGLEQTLYGAITDEGARVESKFEYNSVIGLNGVFYAAGFGLITTATGGDGSEQDPYDSEFWINAEKFKFTNSAVSGSTAPFTIDASGTTPQITFNGVVDFTNTDMSSYDNSNVDVSGVISSNNDAIAQYLGYADYASLISEAAAGHTIISGGYLNTNIVDVDTLLIDSTLSSTDGLFYADMENQILHSEDGNGNYVEITPGTMLFYNAADTDKNLLWEDGVLTLPALCVDTAHIVEASIDTIHVSNEAITSASFVTGTSLTLNLTETAKVLIIANVTFNSSYFSLSAGATKYVYLNKNGTTVTTQKASVGGAHLEGSQSVGYYMYVTLGSNSIMYSASLPAGNYTFTVTATSTISSCTIAGFKLLR